MANQATPTGENRPKNPVSLAAFYQFVLGGAA